MHSSAETPQQAIAQVRELIQRLDDAFTAQEWDDVPSLLTQRNYAAEHALTAELPPDLHSDAKALIQSLRSQDERLAEVAKQLQEDAGKELLKLHKQKKSIAAYKE